MMSITNSLDNQPTGRSLCSVTMMFASPLVERLNLFSTFNLKDIVHEAVKALVKEEKKKKG